MEGELNKKRGSNNQDVKPRRIQEYEFFLIRDRGSEVTGKGEGGAKEKNEDRNKSVMFFLE